MSQDELSSRVNVCVDFLTRSLDKKKSKSEIKDQVKDYTNLNSIVSNMGMYLDSFNFYPSDLPGNCSKVAFFTSLSSKKWNLRDSERLSFDQMFKYLIRHFQGSCNGLTSYAVLLVDNWDNEIASFWEPNIEYLKKNGVTIEVRMMI